MISLAVCVCHGLLLEWESKRICADICIDNNGIHMGVRESFAQGRNTLKLVPTTILVR